jgi:hypothetical protein
LAGVVGWGAVRTAIDLVGAARGALPRLTRFESAAERDARFQRGMGKRAGLFRLVREQVPEDGTVFLTSRPDLQEHPTFPAVQRFLCPRAWARLDVVADEGYLLVLPGDSFPTGLE